MMKWQVRNVVKVNTAIFFINKLAISVGRIELEL